MQEFFQKGARITRGAHHIWKEVVSAGDIVIDATCGNGHDTIYLARLVGPQVASIRFWQCTFDCSFFNKANVAVDFDCNTGPLMV